MEENVQIEKKRKRLGVTMYPTSDGQYFSSLKEAKSHEKELEVDSQLLDLTSTYELAEAELISKFLLSNKQNLKQILK